MITITATPAIPPNARIKGRRFTGPTVVVVVVVVVDEALNEIASHLRIPMHRWLETSRLYAEYMTQTKLTDFM